MAEEIKMLPVRQKEIVDKITEYGFNKRDFEFIPLTEKRFELYYKQNKFYCFKVDTNLNYNGVPGGGGNPRFHNRMESWDHLLKGLGTWLEYLHANLKVGNPWEDIISEEQKLNSETFGTYQEMLTEEEQKAFSSKLDMMLEHFSVLKLDVSKMKEDINHMKQISSKISRKDLLLLFIGTMSTYMMEGIIPPNKSSELWHFIMNLFAISHNFLSLQ